MLRTIFFIVSLFLLSCKTTTYYITRHAEKLNTITSDPALSAEGEKQALNLKEYLKGKGIKTIYSTNFIRTKSTAQPTSLLFGVPVKIYNPAQSKELVESLKKITAGNVLIVGHSNTVDDIANGLTGINNMTDLADDEYSNLFIVKQRGRKYSFKRIKVPETISR